MWHKSRTQRESDVLKNINISLNLLEELNLFADPSSIKKLVPKQIAGLDPDDMERLQNIFDLIKVDLQLEPKQTDEIALQKITLTENLTSFLETVSATDVSLKVKLLVDDTKHLYDQIGHGLSDFVNYV